MKFRNSDARSYHCGRSGSVGHRLLLLAQTMGARREYLACSAPKSNATTKWRDSGPKEGVMPRKPQDSRYEIVGFCWSFVHAKTGRRVYSRNGRPFPIKRRRR
jgi:hypothetical protein